MNKERKWWNIILWWELGRIPFNVIMYFIGLLSFYICYITIPIVYIVIGIMLNLFYTLGWIIELIFLISRANKTIKVKYFVIAYCSYLLLSVIFVLGYAIYLLG